MAYNKGQVPWNKNKKLSDEIRRHISIGKTGVRFQQQHKDRIAETQRKRWALQRLPSCSQCYSKHCNTNPLFKVLIPAVHETIPLDLCDQCLVSQYHGLSQEEKKGVQIL